MTGIYKITNPKGGIYVGSSRDIFRRWQLHEEAINKRPFQKLYISFKKYGCENHKYEILEICECSQLLIRERYWQEHFKCFTIDNLNHHKANNTIYVNGKRKQDSTRKKYFLDLYTGVYYDTQREIADNYGIKYETFRYYMNNPDKNTITSRFLAV